MCMLWFFGHFSIVIASPMFLNQKAVLRQNFYYKSRIASTKKLLVSRPFIEIYKPFMLALSHEINVTCESALTIFVTPVHDIYLNMTAAGVV